MKINQFQLVHFTISLNKFKSSLIIINYYQMMNKKNKLKVKQILFLKQFQQLLLFYKFNNF